MNQETLPKLITKGSMIDVHHNRTGKFIGFATRDFDPNEELFYPIAVGNKTILGLNTYWEIGETIPCRNSLCTIRVIKPC